MSLTGKTGFFPEYYHNLKNVQSSNFAEDLEKLTECHDDFERLAHVDKMACVQERDHELQVQRSYEGKNATIAAEFKESGNMMFKSKKWLEAMVVYTKSYIALPNDKVAEKAIVIANRSATLYHMEKYDEALIDIQRSIDLDYPKDLIYKLYERQAKCYMAKKDYPNTIESFKKCITAMDNANLQSDKRGKMTLDIMTMIKMLEKDPRTKKQAQAKKGGEVKLTLAIPDEKEFLSASIRFDQSKEEGRFARAASDIDVGEEILVQKPFVAVLLAKCSRTHCENCFVRTVVPVACPNCSDVIYCSEECLNKAASSYHRYECGILQSLWNSGASVNCHMAMRVIGNKSLEYFRKMKNLYQQKLSIEELQKLPKDDYRRIAHLESHAGSRSASNFFQHALMARFLTKCLQMGGYFGENPTDDDILTIGGFILRNLQFIQFNTHEVSELHKSLVKNTEKKTQFIGGALYPTLALFNHSCDPGVVRYFRGNTIHVNTVKPIEAGLQISENYGPIYTQFSREERQAKLKELYWFDCSCDACLENWPTFDKMPLDVIRFRCDAPNKCNAIIVVPATCNDFMIKCVTCGESTNMFKGLKVMQDTEMMTRIANRLYETGEFSKALNKFIDLLKIMNDVLAPPFPDFCHCQQHIKDCFLHFGNYYNLD